MKINGLVGWLTALALCTPIAGPHLAAASGPAGGTTRISDGTAGSIRISDAQDPVVRVSDADVPPAPLAAVPGAEAGPAGIMAGSFQSPVEGASYNNCNNCNHCNQCNVDGFGGYGDGYVNDGPLGFSLFGGRGQVNRRGWVAGGGVVSLEADFDSNTAFFIDDQTGPVNILTSQDFDYELAAGWRAWLGWQDGSGLSYRVSYFDWDDNETEQAIAPADFVFFNGLETPTTIGGLLAGGTVGDFIRARSSIEVYYIDAEIMQELAFDRWQTTFGGGYRHVGIAQNYAAVGTAGGVLVASDIGQRFDGDGPTAFGEVRIPFLGYSDRRYIGAANVSLFANARGSIVFGEGKLTATDVNPTFPGTSVAVARIEDRDSVKICELRVGGQFDIRPADGSLIYVTIGYEAHWLEGANSFSDVNDDNDLTLRGWFFGAGAEW